jgi:hypothetical protein
MNHPLGVFVCGPGGGRIIDISFENLQILISEQMAKVLLPTRRIVIDHCYPIAFVEQFFHGM